MITITQTCDSCRSKRELSVGTTGVDETIKKAAEKDGWREVRQDAHLCSNCIKALISQK